jgi:aldehyde dehydrogenase (NAD+)
MDWDSGWEYGAALEPAVPVTRCSPFVDGTFVDGAGDPATALNPTTDSGLAEVGTAGPADVDAAVAAARRALATWTALPGADRTRLLSRAARIVAARTTELAMLETLGTGRPVRLTRDVDVPTAVAHLQSCAGWADKLGYAGHGPDPTPVGVVAALVADRSPLLAAVRRIAPALACGDTVVLVPDPDAPLTALALADAFGEAGLPDGVLNVLPGASAALGGHAGVDAVVVAGPVDVPARSGPGRLVVERAGRGVHVVHDDAPLDQAVDGVVEALGTDRRVLVAESVAEEFGVLLCGRVARLRVGDPRDANTDLGPVRSRELRDRAADLIAAGEAAGTRRFTSPAGLPEQGAFLAPTVFLDVAPTDRLAREEITGPVLPVSTFRTPAEAVALAAAPRTAAVWTDKGSRALWTAQRLRADVVWVNAVDRFDPAIRGAALADFLNV